MQIRWTPEAGFDLECIAEDNSEAAVKAAGTIFHRIENLVNFPQVGRPGREEGTRELVLAPLPYVVVYRVNDSAVEILRIWHGAQNRTNQPQKR
jgi:toxin ParE1/3/4